MNFMIHATVKQLAAGFDEQMCHLKPSLLEMDRNTRSVSAAVTLEYHYPELVECRTTVTEVDAFYPTDKLLELSGGPIDKLPSRLVDLPGPAGWQGLFMMVYFLEATSKRHAICGIDCTTLLSSYNEVMSPVRQGLLRVGGWNRSGRMRLCPTEQGLQSGLVPRGNVILSRIGLHL